MLSSNQFQSHFLKIGENQLHYIDEGQGQPILMLHGNPTWSYYYRHLIDAFKDKFRMIAPDHMGMGLSNKPQDYDYRLENHQNNILSLIKFLDLKDIILVVHDWGGPIGLGALKERPDLFKKIVVLNTAGFLSQDIPFRIRVCRWGRLGEYLVRKFNLFAWPATFMAPKKRLRPEIKQQYLAPYHDFDSRIAVARFVQDIPLEKNHPSYQNLKNIDEYLKEINLPMLIAWGGQDFCFHRSFFEEWVRRFPKAHAYWFNQAGHYILEDIPEVLIPLLNQFFNNKL